MNDSDRLGQLVAMVKKMRAAQQAYFAGRGSVQQAKQLEAAVDRWLTENGFADQRPLFHEQDLTTETQRARR